MPSGDRAAMASAASGAAGIAPAAPLRARRACRNADKWAPTLSLIRCFGPQEPLSWCALWRRGYPGVVYKSSSLSAILFPSIHASSTERSRIPRPGGIAEDMTPELPKLHVVRCVH
ncbi:hypothetical protein MTO96_012064 [Rhipicephalus appendiculatus]